MLDKSTSTWSIKTWNGLTNFDGNNVWSDRDTTYFSYSGINYVLDKSTSTWSRISFTGIVSIDANYIWTDGNNTYYSYDANQKVLSGAAFSEFINISGNDYIMLYNITNGSNDTRSIIASVGEDLSGIATVVSSVGSSDATTLQKSGYTRLLIRVNNGYYTFIDAVVINTNPILNASNRPASIEINEGEELGNMGMSFESQTGDRVEVTILVTLNGERVKTLDTNVPGVYNVRLIAKDKLGHTTVVNKEVVVKENEKEETLVNEEVVVETKEEVKTTTEEKKAEKENKVEIRENETMRIERKVNVREYARKKETRSLIERIFSFKLFSKYFFKVYDG